MQNISHGMAACRKLVNTTWKCTFVVRSILDLNAISLYLTAKGFLSHVAMWLKSEADHSLSTG